jgi:hypothetical protein
MAAMELVEEAPVFGAKVPTAQVSACGAKVTFSPFMPETRRPLTMT